jgi:hypothetical protein
VMLIVAAARGLGALRERERVVLFDIHDGRWFSR